MENGRVALVSVVLWERGDGEGPLGDEEQVLLCWEALKGRQLFSVIIQALPLQLLRSLYTHTHIYP